jgi:peroxiredoxin
MKLGLVAFALAIGLSPNLTVGFNFDARPDEQSAPVTAPEFVGVTEWLNSKPLKLADQKGRVVIVHFWTNGCINCIHNYSHYRAWTTKYKDNKELLMVGIHTPEFDAEKDVERIKARAEKNRLTFAIAVDNNQTNWKAWQNQYWPCIYLVDKTGNVRYRWAGELGDDGFKKVSGLIDELLAEKAAKGK